MKRFFAFVACILLLVLIYPKSYASEYTTSTNLWHWLAGGINNNTVLNWLQNTVGRGNILGYIQSTDVCSRSQDNKHHASSVTGISDSGYCICVCEDCGNEFTSSTLASDVYNDYKDSLPAQSVNSDGGVIWSPTLDDVVTLHFAIGTYVNFSPSDIYYSADNNFSLNTHGDYSNSVSTSFYDNKILSLSVSSNSQGALLSCKDITFKVPINGQYKSNVGLMTSGFKSNEQYIGYWNESINTVSTNEYKWAFNRTLVQLVEYTSFSGFFYLPIFTITPLIPFSVNSTSDFDIYNIGTRAASITGNYGIVNSGGTVEQIQTQNIVNETNNTYYSPSTGEMQEFSSWSYDYSDRSYNLTTEEGDTVNVTYGDEYMTITEGSTTTNIYYITNVSGDNENGGEGGSGSGGNGTPVHTHSYTSEVTKEPTCIRTGVRTYTCSCGAMFTETLPANKHDWQIVSDVKNEYDAETGELMQQGYSIRVFSVRTAIQTG